MLPSVSAHREPHVSDKEKGASVYSVMRLSLAVDAHSQPSRPPGSLPALHSPRPRAASRHPHAIQHRPRASLRPRAPPRSSLERHSLCADLQVHSATRRLVGTNGIFGGTLSHLQASTGRFVASTAFQAARASSHCPSSCTQGTSCTTLGTRKVEDHAQAPLRQDRVRIRIQSFVSFVNTHS